MASFATEPNPLRDSATLVFPRCVSFAKPNDLDIVRKIVEREGCIEALEQLLEAAKRPQQPRISGISKAPIVFQSVIDQIRSVSVQIVEDIEQWQQQQTAKAYATNFKWRCVNYLLKMTADLDFLTSFRGVQLLESLQILRLMQNPFFAQMHLDHPVLRESDPEPAVQLFGNWVGDISMRRVFSASKLLLRERDAEARCRQIRLKQSPKKTDLVSVDHSTGDPDSDSTVVTPLDASTQQKISPIREQVHISNRNTPLSVDPISSTPREATLREDIVLSRELITQAEHELGAMRDNLAVLQKRLEGVILPDKRRRLKTRIGSLINDLKFRSGDLYQRKNELKHKEAIYRMTKGRRGSSHDSRRFSRLVVNTEPIRKESPQFEMALLEDEKVRNDLVSRVKALLSKARTNDHTQGLGLTIPSRRLQSSEESQSHQLEVARWGAREVQTFLDALGLDDGRYGAMFRAHGIDGQLLLQATDRDLEELGVNIRLHRVRILRECKMGKSMEIELGRSRC
ncbi:hypothetical protein PHMEG_0009334 [Phytophthora megakarya]|uniref:SAM domain-containing protein n=1 Tax=Phytophthora megakarya TaxID=4795 RepID=A0A225WHD2_9STRA|nr:hypothetical protein PHMEG_0009334 [Phytophthora megakarya]